MPRLILENPQGIQTILASGKRDGLSVLMATLASVDERGWRLRGVCGGYDLRDGTRLRIEA